MRLFLASLATAAVTATGAMAGSLSDIYSSFFVLGDSLSDTGNLVIPDGTGGVVPLLPAPYYQAPDALGRQWSDGPVWSDQLDDQFDTDPTDGTLNSRNYAFGGATALTGSAVPSLTEQVGLLLSDLALLAPDAFEAIQPGTPTIGDNALTSLWFGANDAFGVLQAGLEDALALQAMEAAATAVAGAVATLTDLPGFDTFLVFNLPDIGAAPAYFGDTLASQLSATFNATLAGLLAPLEGDGTRIVTVDIASIFESLTADITAGLMPLGLDDATNFCVLTDGSIPRNLVSDCGDPTGLLFWDPVHPTAVAHAEIARVAQTAVVPLPAGLPLLLAGLGALGLVARRRRAAA